MELRHIDSGQLTVSPANMRGKAKPDIANILPSVRARGILVPLIVRANCDPDRFEIVAGKRRYFAALTVTEEAGGIEPLPCAVMEAGDDAAALEASLIENIARLAGENGRAKVDGWVPKWMAFPPAAYTDRGGVGTVSRAEAVAGLIAPEPQAEAPVEPAAAELAHAA